MAGKKRWILARDLPRLLDPPAPNRPVHLLGPHDPYLGLYDREQILPDKASQQRSWRTSGNPGAIMAGGSVTGLWRTTRQGGRVTIHAEPWSGAGGLPAGIRQEMEAWAEFQDLRLEAIAVG